MRQRQPDRLGEYRRKRDPERTAEPFSSGPALGSGPIFVVQRHAARRLHYDLRLERDGALASWAVPKGVPLEPGARNLAVHVEDHPLSYASFEGEIPAGEYGAGAVEIWDRGTYELLEEKKDGGLTFRLEGDRLRGVWTLVPAALDGDEKNWLLLRKPGTGGPPLPGGRPSYRPMLATLAERLPSGAGWLYEVKWDGYRAIARVAGGTATLTSRAANDLTSRFGTVARALPGALRSPDCVVDGEICALDEQGRPSFGAIQAGVGQLVYYLFDLLELDGAPLVDLPYRERRDRLGALLVPGGAVRASDGFSDGQALLDAVSSRGLEGVIAKRADSRYQAGRRSRDWLKVKTHARQELVVAGYTPGQGRRSGTLGALVLGVHRAGRLVWAGNCGTGFTEGEIERLLRRLRPLTRPTSPLAEVARMPRVRRQDVIWVEPELVCEVEFAEWTVAGRLRAPSYKGLREDEPVEDVRAERPLPEEIRKGRRVLRLSNLDKVFWPADGLTKGDLLSYYREVGPALLPHLRDRAFTMKRFPDGIEGKHFFQKDAPSHMPEWIPRRRFETVSRGSGKARTIDYPLVNDELAMLWVVNMGTIDLNIPLSRVDLPGRPDVVLFDLDPAPPAGFAESVRVALLVKQLLDSVGLAGYPKTSGSDGMHVLVPISRRHTFADTYRFASIAAGALERAYPELVTTQFRKEKRRGVLIDANQNGEGRTIASVYSVRPHPGAPVSTPLRWEELSLELDPKAFTMEVVLGRLDRHGDLFAGALAGGQSLRAALAAID
jgi:bifunctional non-homologous end joining protein LigD